MCCSWVSDINFSDNSVGVSVGRSASSSGPSPPLVAHASTGTGTSCFLGIILSAINLARAVSYASAASYSVLRIPSLWRAPRILPACSMSASSLIPSRLFLCLARSGVATLHAGTCIAVTIPKVPDRKPSEARLPLASQFVLHSHLFCVAHYHHFFTCFRIGKSFPHSHAVPCVCFGPPIRVLFE